MWRFRFILGLIIIAVCLFFAAKTARMALTLIQPYHPALADARPVPQVKHPNVLKQMVAHFTASVKKGTDFVKEQVPAKPVLPKPAAKEETPAGPAIMKITLEEERLPIHNTALGKEVSARLTEQLQNRLLQNNELVKDVGNFFGPEAKQAVQEIALKDERESIKNAQTSKTLDEFTDRQQKIDRKTTDRLQAVYEKHKAEFNYRQKKAAPEWKEFYQRSDRYKSAPVHL